MAGRKSIYSEKQWRWVADRYLEGYFIKDLAEFLWMNRRNVERRLRNMGRSEEGIHGVGVMAGATNVPVFIA